MYSRPAHHHSVTHTVWDLASLAQAAGIGCPATEQRGCQNSATCPGLFSLTRSQHAASCWCVYFAAVADKLQQGAVLTSCPPAELPGSVWALILSQAVQGSALDTGKPSSCLTACCCSTEEALVHAGSRAFGPCTPQLQLLVQAATVSHTLRQAAAVAANQLKLCLAPDPQLPPQSLSPLLAELCGPLWGAD